jgi:hypothetical protein
MIQIRYSLRVSGELAQGSAPLLMALKDTGYPAKLAADESIPVATSQLKPRAATTAVREAAVADNGPSIILDQLGRRVRPHTFCEQL